MGNVLNEALSGYSGFAKQKAEIEQEQQPKKDMIPVKIVALEVLKQVKLNTYTEYIALAGIFLVLMLNTLNRMYGIYISIPFIIVICVFLAKDTKQRVYLTKKYLSKNKKEGGGL